MVKLSGSSKLPSPINYAPPSQLTSLLLYMVSAQNVRWVLPTACNILYFECF